MVHRGDSVVLQNTFKDEFDALFDPDTQTIKIYDPSGVLDTTISDPTKQSLGVFRIRYIFAADADYGDWTMLWEATKGQDVKAKFYTFTVTKKPGDT